MTQDEKTLSPEGTAEAQPPANGGAGNGGAGNGGAGEVELEDAWTQLQAELAQEQARYAELLDRYQRAGAEFQNSRRRLEKQMADAVERASTHIIRRILPVLDDLELAFRSVPAGEEQAPWVEGFRAIQKKLVGILEEEGVKPIAASGPFDPTRHEAVSSEPNDSVESGHIIATLRQGYEINGTVVRPAMVRVAQ